MTARIALPIALTVALIAWVLAGHLAKLRAEAAAVDFVSRLHQAQHSFEAEAGGFASALDSLMAPCPSGGGPRLDAAALRDIGNVGYEVRLRPRAGARTLGPDCHGRPLVDDYYVGVQPMSAHEAPMRAYGSTATGRVFVFVDGIAPIELDMAAGGLATPFEDMATFRIP